MSNEDSAICTVLLGDEAIAAFHVGQRDHARTTHASWIRQPDDIVRAGIEAAIAAASSRTQPTETP